MKKIFALVLLAMTSVSFGCGHSASSKSGAVTIAPELPAEVKIGGFVFRKPAGWSMEPEYKCSGIAGPTTDLNGKSSRISVSPRSDSPRPCLARQMRSPLLTLRIKVKVMQINDRKDSATYGLCVLGANKKCRRRGDITAFYSRHDNQQLVFMNFRSRPYSEIMVQIESLSKMSLRERQMFTLFILSIRPVEK